MDCKDNIAPFTTAALPACFLFPSRKASPSSISTLLMASYSNQLVNESSPYLLQHAHNPVDWYPWGPDALQRAKDENKPILVSIGYSACHWCHVMERESFEDEDTAQLMNAEFINIKIDREERPDLDHIYMDAVQAMTGSGGWPLNVFLTPDGRPFYGGTYFPPRRVHNLPSWKETLAGVAEAFRQRPGEVEDQAANLTRHMMQSNSFGMQTGGEGEIRAQRAHEAAINIMKTADREWGGFGKAPKFPQTFTIQFLLRYHHVLTNGMLEETGAGVVPAEALSQALLSLDRMIEGGIYDQVGGGFARYSTDTEWLAPHFEKMLYDNALLITVLSEAYQVTRDERYREVIRETIVFVRRELMNEEGGFYAALDADSEGEEGKFYVWSHDEIGGILGGDAALFSAYYDIRPGGNWEGKSIPRVRIPPSKFAETNGISEEKLTGLLKAGREKLLKMREQRVRPQLDDKILLGWNALMNSALSRAFMATGEASFRELALKNMDFMLSRFSTGQGIELHHTWKAGRGTHPAFLDDYAYLIQALILLQEITGDRGWLMKATELVELVESLFGEPETGFFFYTRADQADIILRKKEIYDGAVPAGNSVMATCLYQLSILLDRGEWQERAATMVSSMARIISQYPTSFGVWASLMMEFVTGSLEVAVVGKDSEELSAKIHELFLPYKVFMRSDSGADEFPLLAGKASTGKPFIYLCKNYSCRQPVDSISRFMSLINSEKKGN